MTSGPAATSAAAETASPVEPVPLLEPRGGLPLVVDSPAALREVVAAFAAATGPVAVDAERASGYRYTQRAYLVQLRRAGAGTALIDPIACPDLHELHDALDDTEWVLHAASQDLACLAGVGLQPPRLFDTELAARLAGFERVGLGALVERLLGFRLEKGHSAADWSQRPLPEPLLHYAALDVELLLELRDVLAEELAAQGKLEWASQEFAAVLAAPPPAPRADRWRRTSGIHRIQNRQQLAVVRSLWQARDRVAVRRDLAPGRVLPDSAIIEAALTSPRTVDALLEIAPFNGPRLRRSASTWWRAIAEARALPDSAWPPITERNGDGPPPANRWSDRDPAAAGRLARARAVLADLAEARRLPVENLLEPALVRRICWTPPKPLDVDSVRAALVAGGARPWQVALTAAPLAAALA